MDDNESVNSYLSWVSEITTCEPLESVLSKFSGNTKFNRKVLEIVTSMKNSIVKNGGTETSTEFYATTVEFLKVTEIDVESIEACTFILKHLTSQHVPVPVLRITTGDLSRILLNFLSGSYGKNELIVKNCLFCLSKLLSIQRDDNWSLDNIKTLYRIMFSYTTDSRKEINKQARKSIMSLFRTKSKTNGPLAKSHPLNRETISILRNSIQRQNTTNKKRDHLDLNIKSSPEDDRLSFSLTMLCSLLKFSMFPNDSMIEYLEILIQCLLSFQIVPIQCQILNHFSELFSARVLQPEQVARCLTSLVSYLQQSSQRSSATSFTIPPAFIAPPWLNTMLTGFEVLLCDSTGSFLDSLNGRQVNCREAALAHAQNLIRLCSNWVMCDTEELRNAATHALTRLCSGELRTRETKHEYIDPSCNDDSDSWFVKWAESLRQVITLASNDSAALVVAMNSLAMLVKRSNGQCQGLFDTLILSIPDIAEIRDALEASSDEAVLMASLSRDSRKAPREKIVFSPEEIRLRHSIDALIGSLIRHYGLERVTQSSNALSLTHVTEMTKRSWLVPVIRSHADHGCLDQFRTVVLPAIREISASIDSIQGPSTDTLPMETDTGAESAPIVPSAAVLSLGTLRYQLWSCLVTMSRNVVPGSLDRVSTSPITWQQDPSGMVTEQNNPKTNTLWELILDLIDPNSVSSNLETIALPSLRALMTTAQDREEARRVLCGPPLYPTLVKHLFGLATTNTGPVRAAVKATLAAYLPLFETDAFLPQARFLMGRKITAMDPASPAVADLACIELVGVLAPHLSVAAIQEVTQVLDKLLENDGVSHTLHKRIYRFYELATTGETDSSRNYCQQEGAGLLDRFQSWTNKVPTDSWKSRLRTLHHLFRALEQPRDGASLVGRFMGEIIAGLALPNRKSRAVAGLLLVDGVLAAAEECGVAGAIDRVLSTVIIAMRAPGSQCRVSLGRALVLVLSEPRLAREVARPHVENSFGLVVELLETHDESSDRQLAQCAIDVLSGLLKHNVGGGGAEGAAVSVTDFGRCISAASEPLRKKMRMSVKRVLKRALKLWDYESVKQVIPADLVAVLRNIHKAMNRAKRNTKTANVKDTESCATSWAGMSEAGTERTMKNPHIKNIAELLDDTDDEDDEDLKSRASASTVASKKSSVSRASELRKERKRKIDRANATLFLEENVDDIVDLSDPTSMVRNLRIVDRPSSSKKVTIAEDQSTNQKSDKVVDRRGFHFEAGRLVIGQSVEEKKVNDDEEEENEHYKSEKERFQPAKKRAKRERLPGSEYKSNKKGVFGDMKRKDKPNPYAFIPLDSAEKCHSIMSKYEKVAKKAMKEARTMAKQRKRKATK